MQHEIKIDDIHDKNINFLIGAGASYGLFPTLTLEIKNDEDKKCTIETLATIFDKGGNKEAHTLLFMYYFQECIYPAMLLNIDDLVDEKQKSVIDNYKIFLETINQILYRKKVSTRRCNIFTTNYDGCLALTADIILKEHKVEFVINDGTRGFSKRYLQAKNFNSFIYQTGIFEQHNIDIPQINLINLHGSVYWYKDGAESIIVNYQDKNASIIPDDVVPELTKFKNILNDPTKTISDLNVFINTNLDKNVVNGTTIDNFWNMYNKLPIVNPTKWKFHETVFEEHYYQMLRALSYEFEKPNAIFITFGFSFADEHILNLCKRSLSNPLLQLFICCFNDNEFKVMKDKFSGYKNVDFIGIDNQELNFAEFNNQVFTLTPMCNNPESKI